MDDFNVSSLHESRNEWASRLVTILTPAILDGYRSIFDEAFKLCKENNELDKYLMTFQNFISRIPKWNTSIIETEKIRICEKSGCTYLEDLITCVHIIQLKILTAMRVGQKQKKIDINIPKLDEFIHKCYIHVARKIYKNVYLFEINIKPLEMQKHNRELEIIIQEAILNTLRESIPVETILKAYLEETVEEEVVEEIKEQVIEEPLIESYNNNTNQNNQNNQNQLSFNNIDSIQDVNKNITNIDAPKTLDRLEEISELRNSQRKMEFSVNGENENENENENIKLNISSDSLELGDLDVHVIDEPKINLLPDLLIDDIEILE
jgi:hypothetical protein